jgi:hypothetical protein
MYLHRAAQLCLGLVVPLAIDFHEADLAMAVSKHVREISVLRVRIRRSLENADGLAESKFPLVVLLRLAKSDAHFPFDTAHFNPKRILGVLCRVGVWPGSALH